MRGAAVLEDHKSGHRNRLKAKYIENSANLVYDYEALELLLTYAIPRRDVKPIAKALLEHFGTLENVFAAKEKQLCAVNGVGQNTAVLITLVKDLQIRCAKRKNKVDLPLLAGKRGNFFVLYGKSGCLFMANSL